MSLQWYYAQDGKTLGPVSGERLQELSRRGELASSDLVWRDGMTDWVAAGSVGIGSVVVSPPPLPPTPSPFSSGYPTAAIPAKPVGGNRSHTSAHSQLLFLSIAIFGTVVGIGGYWLVQADRRAPQVEMKELVKGGEHPVRDKRAEGRSKLRGSDVAPIPLVLAEPSHPADEISSPAKPAGETTTVTTAPPEMPLDKKGGDPVPFFPPPTAPSEPAPSLALQPPASQPLASNTPPTQSRRTLYQQVEIQRYPRFSVSGFESTQSIRYLLLSRLEVEPPSDGQRTVVQFVQDTQLLAADDLSRDAFAKSLEELKKQQFTYILNDRGEVISFTGHKANLATLPVDQTSISGFAMTSVIDKDGWKELAELTFLVPDPKAPANRPWQRQMNHDWGALGRWYGMTTLERGGSAKDLQEIKYTHEMTYVKPDAANGALPFRIVDARFEPQQAGGRLELDSRRQQVRLAQEVFEVRGEVQAELLGQTVEIQLSEKQLIELRILDQSPRSQNDNR